MSLFKKTFFIALAFFSITDQANAGVITYTFGSPMSGTVVDTFNSLLVGSSGSSALPDNTGEVTLNTAAIEQGTVASHYAQPYLDTTPYVAVQPMGTATFSLNSPTEYFGFEWGSVDTYNTLTFLNGTNVIGVIPGQDILTAANLQNGNEGAQGTVFANFNSTQAFNEVVASTSGIAFELDNVHISAGHAGAVPLPASLPLFGAAIALAFLGASSSRKTYRKV